MKTPQYLLSQRLHGAITQIAPDAALPAGPLAVPAQDSRFGDYQCNAAMALAKTLKSNPRAVAAQIIEHLDVADMADAPSIAGPGFINLRLTSAWLSAQLEGAARAADGRLGMEPVETPDTIVLDYSSPNVAKSMHIGHIRSTVIGDALARMLRFTGHKVIADNHLGDWGTAFGTLIAGYRDVGDEAAFRVDPLAELERVYKICTERVKQDPAFKERVRYETARMQSGNEDNLRLWRMFMDASRLAYERIYQRLDVHFDLWHGESFYNPMLAETVQALMDAGIARESEGAIVIFYDGDPELADHNLIIRKGDGAALYSTTDLAGIRYRVEHYHPQRIVILTDGRQQLHFKQVFNAARRWGYRDVDMVHVWFGTIFGPDGKPIKTREGEPPKLEAVLDEAEERALAVVRDSDKNAGLTEAEQREIARVVGLGAVKYADLSQNRTSDYVFSWEKMLALNGNTGPYLQYAYARIQSIFRKGNIEPADLHGPITLEAEQERALGLHILRFGEALAAALEVYRPHTLTTYLYELAVAFSSFFENCPVLTAEEPLKSSRLTLIRLTGEALKLGLHLLGIETLDRM